MSTTRRQHVYTSAVILGHRLHHLRRCPMTADLSTLLTIGQVCHRLPGARGARHVNPSTVTRWILTGCPSRDGTRVRLAAIRCGGRWMVRQEDLDAFFSTLAADPTTTTPAPSIRTLPAREQASAAAGSAAAKMGY